MAFDGFRDRGYYQGVRHYYNFDHIRNLVASGGQKLAKDKSEFIAAINQYLADPGLDQAGRARLVFQQCGQVDGLASARLANYLLFFC